MTRLVQRCKQNIAAAVVMFCLCLTLQDAFADNDAKLQQISADIQKLEQWLKETRTEHDQLSQKLRQSDEAISAIVRKVEATRAQLKQEQARLKKLQQEQKQLRLLKNEHTQTLKQQVLASHQLGQQSGVKVLFNQQDPQSARRMMQYYGYFNRARMDSIDTVIANIQRLNRIEQAIAEQQDVLQQSENQLLNDQRALQKTQQQHKNLLAQLDQQIHQRRNSLQQKETDREELKQLIQEVVTLLDRSVREQDARPIRALKGKLPKPVQGRIVKAFGNQNRESRSHWQGWLIKASEGAPIKSIHHGRVVFSDWLRGFGLLIIVDHGDGYLSLYARNQSLLKSVGDWVHQGDTIATLGKSGGYPQPRLYFEIRHKGTPIDPATWLTRR